jgi:hypothetical protein
VGEAQSFVVSERIVANAVARRAPRGMANAILLELPGFAPRGSDWGYSLSPEQT